MSGVRRGWRAGSSRCWGWRSPSWRSPTSAASPSVGSQEQARLRTAMAISSSNGMGSGRHCLPGCDRGRGAAAGRYAPPRRRRRRLRSGPPTPGDDGRWRSGPVGRRSARAARPREPDQPFLLVVSGSSPANCRRPSRPVDNPWHGSGGSAELPGMPRLDGPLLSLATRQDGLLPATSCSLRARAGRRITRACSDWPRILPGVFLTDARPVDVDVRCRAVAMRWPDAVLCQDTAGRRRGWPFLTDFPTGRLARSRMPGGAGDPLHSATAERRPPAGYHRREPGRPALVRGSRSRTS